MKQQKKDREARKKAKVLALKAAKESGQKATADNAEEAGDYEFDMDASENEVFGVSRVSGFTRFGGGNTSPRLDNTAEAGRD